MLRLAEDALPLYNSPLSPPCLAFIFPLHRPYPSPIRTVIPIDLPHISPISPEVLRLAEDALPPEMRPPVAGYLPLSARALVGRYPATGARHAPYVAVDEEVDARLDPMTLALAFISLDPRASIYLS